LDIKSNIIPEDNSTLFICSGMQGFKPRFSQPDGGKEGTLQSCIRTNDIEEVGDGTHLTYFQMLGNFSFGNNDYSVSVEMWVELLKKFKLFNDCVIHIHPSQEIHRNIWLKYTSQLENDPSCQWSDGTIGGYCCEVYYHGLEIGNLVNPLEHSTDVGFGFERLVQVIQGKNRVDETDLFDQSLDPISRDHVRTLLLLQENGILPGNKGRNYQTRRLCRRILQRNPLFTYKGLEQMFESERRKLTEVVRLGKRMWLKYQTESEQWWKETVGMTKEELKPLLNHKT
jgi:alanyl-tRNA synthetase